MGDTAIPQDKSNIQKYLGVSICIVLCCAKLLLPYLTLCDSVDHRLPGAFVHGSPFSTLGDLPDPGIKLMSLVSLALAGGFFTTVPCIQ